MGADDAMLMAGDIGEIKGQLKAIHLLLQSGQDNTNQQIASLQRSVDEQTSALNTRMNDHKESVDRRFKNHDKQLNDMRRNSIITSGGTGGGVAVFAYGCVEFIKSMLNTG